MNFKDLTNKLFSKEQTEQTELTEEENDCVLKLRDLFEPYPGSDNCYGIPSYPKLRYLLKTTDDDPILRAVKAAWEESKVNRNIIDRIRDAMTKVEPPSFDRYVPILKNFENVTDEELIKGIEKYEKELIEIRDVKALRELSAIVKDMHEENKDGEIMDHRSLEEKI